MTDVKDDHSKMLVIKGFEIRDMIRFRERPVFGKQRTLVSASTIRTFSSLQDFKICLNLRWAGGSKCLK